MVKSKSKKKNKNSKGGKIQVHGHDAGLVAEAEQVIADGGWGWEPADMGHGVENKSTAAQLRNTINKNNAKAAAALSKKGKKK